MFNWNFINIMIIYIQPINFITLYILWKIIFII